MSWGKNCLIFIGVVLILMLGSSCQQQINYPAPTVTALSPANANAGQPAFTITVSGAHLTPASTVLWNGSPRISLFQDDGHITANILQSDIENPGKAQVTVTTPQPGGGTFLPPLDFTINPVAVPRPSITSMSPTGVLASTGALTLLISGNNFVSTSIATINGQNRTTAERNSTVLAVALTAADVATAGTLQIAVINPPVPNPPAGTAPGGGSSNIVPFNVTNPFPQITSLAPNGGSVGTIGATPVTVTGVGLVPGSVVTINGSPRVTSLSASNTLTATLTVGDLATAGVDRIQVVNPAPGGGTSNSLPFAVDPSLTQGLPVLVDYGFDGTLSNSGICGDASTCASAATTNGIPSLSTAGPSVTTSAAQVAYASISSNLVQGQTSSASQIFVTATCIGTNSTCVPSTVEASVGPNNAVANGPSTEPSIAGSDVVFTSLATNLTNYATVPPGHRQVYWEPLCTSSATTPCNGAALVSIGVDGSAGNGDSYDATISSDGQFVAFVSLATNLVPNSTGLINGSDPQVYVRSVCSGTTPQGTTIGSTTTSACTPTTYLVSSTDGVTPGKGASGHPSVAGGGGYVAFESSALDLLPANSSAPQIFVQQVCQILTPGCTSPTTSIVSTPDGAASADQPSIEPAISSDGRFVAFASAAGNLGIFTNSVQQIFVRDTCNSNVSGATTVTGCTPSTKLVSTQNGSAPALGLSENPTIGDTCTTTTTTCSAGPVIAFSSLANNLGPNVNTGVENIFARNTCLAVATGTACTTGTTLVSLPAGISPAPSNGNSTMPAVTSDGHAVAFLSVSTNLVSASTGGLVHVYVGSTSF